MCDIVLRQRGEPKVRLHDLEVREQLLGLIVLDARVHDDIFARHPVDWCCDAVLVASLERVNNAQNLRRVATRRSGVGEDGADRFLGIDDVDRADSKGNTLLVNVGGVLVIEPES